MFYLYPSRCSLVVIASNIFFNSKHYLQPKEFLESFQRFQHCGNFHMLQGETKIEICTVVIIFYQILSLNELSTSHRRFFCSKTQTFIAFTAVHSWFVKVADFGSGCSYPGWLGIGCWPATTAARQWPRVTLFCSRVERRRNQDNFGIKGGGR